jgi:hypothetical protein
MLVKMMNTSKKHEDDIPGTLIFKLTPSAKTADFCYSTWAGEQLEYVKCTRVIMPTSQNDESNGSNQKHLPPICVSELADVASVSLHVEVAEDQDPKCAKLHAEQSHTTTGQTTSSICLTEPARKNSPTKIRNQIHGHCTKPIRPSA